MTAASSHTHPDEPSLPRIVEQLCALGLRMEIGRSVAGFDESLGFGHMCLLDCIVEAVEEVEEESGVGTAFEDDSVLKRMQTSMLGGGYGHGGDGTCVVAEAARMLTSVPCEVFCAAARLPFGGTLSWKTKGAVGEVEFHKPTLECVGELLPAG
jgi:hypothetical protein